jgi:multiple sugar transport system substrate-binding protein
MAEADSHQQNVGSPTISRRLFLRGLLGGTGSAVTLALLAACGAENPAVAPANNSSAAATSAPAPAAATSAPATIKGTVTLTLMYGVEEFPDEELQPFLAANPNILVERIEEDDTRFKAMLAAGTPPDLFRTSATAVPSLAHRGILLDLSPYLAASSLVRQDDLAPVNADYRYDGKNVRQGAIYGMAKDWSPDFTNFANKAAFEEAGVALPSMSEPPRYNDLLPLAEQLTKREGDRTARIGYAYSYGSILPIVQFRLMEAGGKLYSDDLTRINLKASPEAMEALRLFFDLAEQNLTWTPLNPSPNQWSAKDFMQGMVGLISNGYWFSGLLNTTEDSLVKDQVVMLPSPTWGGMRYNPSMGSAGTAIASATKNPDAAWKLFEFYNGGEPAQNRAKSGWGVPALKSLYSLMPSENAFQQQVQQVLQAELEHANAPMEINPFYDSSVFATSWKTHLEQALRGTTSFEQLVETVENEVNAAIADGVAARG